MLTSDVAAAQDVRPYSIELVPVDRGWILEKIADEIARAAAREPGRYQVDVTTHPSGRAELTFFLPESAWRDDLRDTIRVTYLAHKEDHPDAAALFEAVARKSDYCITSSSKYADVLRADGAREVFTIPLGVDTELFVPRIRIGVVGRTYHTGRKGESLLARSMDLPFVEFVFTGEGWPLPARHYGERDLVEFYQSLDYLLVPSLIEGGPVPMLEALATGCRVIAPSDIGMVRDFPHIAFRRGDAEDLRRVLERELRERLVLRAAALPCDWQHFAERHLELFARLIERRRAHLAGPRIVPGASARPHCRALLVTHGPEESAKGGPTTRVRNIVSHLRARGLSAEAGHDARAIAAERYDVVHVFNSWPPDSALATLVAAKRAGAKVVFSPIALDLADWPLFHPFMERLFRSGLADESLRATLAAVRTATPPRRYPGEGADVAIEGIPGLFEKLRLCCDLADQLVLLSEYERAYLGSLGARIDHAVIIRNGVDVEQMRGGDAERFRTQFGLDRYLLCVGRIEYRKNQALAALAARDLDAQFVLVGAAGDPGYVEHVKRLGGRRVRIIDRVEDRSMLASAYAGAAAFVFPSWTEGAPLAAMEAGAAGTPLVLGQMSSEREYFENDAGYVHPADIEAIRTAAQQALAHPEDPVHREARGRRLAARFSIARHSEETWALYERLKATKPQACTVVADVSALLHFVRVRQPFTGVPLVERNVLRELAHLDPGLRTIVFNDVKGRFIEIGVPDLDDFDEATFNARHWFAPDDHAHTDRRCVIRFADRSTPALPYSSPPSRPARATFKTRAIIFGKKAMQRAPRAFRSPVIALAQRLRPGFDPFRMPVGYPAAADVAGLDPGPSLPLAEPVGIAQLRFQHPLATVLIHTVPCQRPVVPAGARLLSLGQSWLSNGPLLDELIRLVETRALSLEPYVYDLTYHTGANQTGWADNDDRFARLLKLLRHSHVVFTESRQVEEELQKLRSSRGLAYRTRRTGLRGRELREAAGHAAAPRYRPDSFVLVVSSFNRRKNHDFLIRVWTNLHETWIRPAAHDFRLVLVGQVQEERKYADPAFVAHLKRSNIDVHADLPDPALTRLMRDCAFTAYPSLQEGWGLPAQESLMCGKLCLVSSTLPVAQEIRNPALIRIAPDDFYGWHEALKSWLDNAPMRRAFAERARDYVPPTWREIAETIAFSAP